MSNKTSVAASKFNEDEINDLISRLQALLSQLNRRPNSRISVSQVLKETCSHIKRLHKEVNSLSERLSELMESSDIRDTDIEETITRILQE